YVALFWLAGEGVAAIAGQPPRIILGVAMVAAVALLLWRLLPAIEPALRGPVAAYAFAILAMGLASLTLPLPLALLGAALFMASDALLATGRFLMTPDSRHQSWTQPAVWALYVAAQLCITLAFVA